MKLRHATLIGLSGLLWFGVGIMLLPLGLRLLVESSLQDPKNLPLLGWVSGWAGGGQTAALLVIALSMGVGYLKSRSVLAKSVRRNVVRIQTFPNPTSVMNLFSVGYLILIGSMIGLGFAIKFFEVPADIRGMIDVAVGTALINGSASFFRIAWNTRAQQST